MGSKKTKTIAVRVTNEMHDKIVELANNTGNTVNDVIKEELRNSSMLNAPSLKMLIRKHEDVYENKFQVSLTKARGVDTAVLVVEDDKVETVDDLLNVLDFGMSSAKDYECLVDPTPLEHIVDPEAMQKWYKHVEPRHADGKDEGFEPVCEVHNPSQQMVRLDKIPEGENPSDYMVLDPLRVYVDEIPEGENEADYKKAYDCTENDVAKYKFWKEPPPVYVKKREFFSREVVEKAYDIDLSVAFEGVQELESPGFDSRREQVPPLDELFTVDDFEAMSMMAFTQPLYKKRETLTQQTSTAHLPIPVREHVCDLGELFTEEASRR